MPRGISRNTKRGLGTTLPVSRDQGKLLTEEKIILPSNEVEAFVGAGSDLEITGFALNTSEGAFIDFISTFFIGSVD